MEDTQIDVKDVLRLVQRKATIEKMWNNDTATSYNGDWLVGMFLWSDVNSPSDPNEMLDNWRYYMLPNEPWWAMSASQIRDLVDLIEFVDERVGAPQFRIYLALKDKHDLVLMEDYNLIED